MRPGTWRIEWRPLAADDLRAIVRSIGRDNRGAAREFAGRLRARFEVLAQRPEIGVPGRIAATRELVVHPDCIAFYRIRGNAGSVEILRVKHSARQHPGT